MNAHQSEKPGRLFEEQLPELVARLVSGEVKIGDVSFTDLFRLSQEINLAISDRTVQVEPNRQQEIEKPFTDFIDPTRFSAALAAINHCGDPSAPIITPEFHKEKRSGGGETVVAHGVKVKCASCYRSISLPPTEEDGMAISAWREANNVQYINNPVNTEQGKPMGKAGSGEVLKESYQLPKVIDDNDDETHRGGDTGMTIVADQAVFMGPDPTVAENVYANRLIVAPYGAIQARLVVATGGVASEAVGDRPSSITAETLIVGPGEIKHYDNARCGDPELTQHVGKINTGILIMLPGAKLNVGAMSCDRLIMLEGAELCTCGKIGEILSDGSGYKLTGGSYGMGEVGEQKVKGGNEIKTIIEDLLEPIKPYIVKQCK